MKHCSADCSAAMVAAHEALDPAAPDHSQCEITLLTCPLDSYQGHPPGTRHRGSRSRAAQAGEVGRSARRKATGISVAVTRKDGGEGLIFTLVDARAMLGKNRPPPPPPARAGGEWTKPI